MEAESNASLTQPTTVLSPEGTNRAQNVPKGTFCRAIRRGIDSGQPGAQSEGRSQAS